MEIDVNGKNVSTTADTSEVNSTEKWNIKRLYETNFTVDSLVKTLEVIDVFKRKYPNDETIQDFEDIVRDEICQLFGGTTIEIS